MLLLGVTRFLRMIAHPSPFQHPIFEETENLALALACFYVISEHASLASLLKQTFGAFVVHPGGS